MTEAEHEARYAMFENAIAELRDEVAALKKARITSMRMTGCCPSCRGRRLLHFKWLRDSSGQKAAKMSLAMDEPTVIGSFIGKGTGVLEAFACMSCRLVELGAITLDDVNIDGDNVAMVSTEEEVAVDPTTVGPYR